nr:zinc finger, CCHC-type [Tanacetum cinerariifolium]
MSDDGKNKEIISHKEVTSFSQFQCPILKSTNYTVWALRIKTILRANGLWETIEPEGNAEIDIKKDMATTAYLYQALPEDMILQVASCKSAKEIWEALQTRHVGVDRVQKARLQTFKMEFEMLKMKEDDSIDDFLAKLNSIVTRASAIEQFIDLETTTLDETIGRLKTFEEIINLFGENPSDNQDKLLFTNHDNSLSHDKGFKNSGHEKFRSSQDNKHDGKSKQFNNDRKPSHKFKKNNFQKGTKDSSKVKCFNCNSLDTLGETANKRIEDKSNQTCKFKKNNFQKGTKDSSKVKCFNCNKFGRVRRNCKRKDRGQEQSNLVQEDEEPTLLMAVQGKGEKGKEILLNEKEIKPKKYISTDESLWYLDNGASNHMTGIRTHFKEIDGKISGRVRFGDGSYVEIKGRGSILLECKNKEQKMTQKKLVEGMPNINHKSQVCNACLLGKHSIAPFPNQTNTKSSEPLNLVFGDLCGPISPETESGKKYMFLLVDDCTRYMWTYFLKSKDEAFATFKEFKLKVENEVGKKLKSFRTDRGGEFTSREFIRYCKENGILKQLTAPYSPQQNGIVERRNRVPTKALKDSTPYEALKGRKPNMRHLRVFGCKAYAKVTKPHLKKLDDRSRELVYLGTEPGSKAYRLLDPVTKEIVNNTYEYMSDDDVFEQPIENPSTPPPYTYEPNSKGSTGHTSSIASSSRSFDHTPVQGYGNISEIYNRALEVQSDELLLLEEEPRNYKEAVQDRKWIEAMQMEIDSINKNKTWKLTTLPDNQKAIGLKWVFKTKRDADGKTIKHKARLVAKRYVQEHGIDYDEVFAPVARMETVRLILALSAYHGWEVHHLDVKLAFLHGELKEEVYVSQPEGFKKP